LIDQTEWLPLLNISNVWVNYPESPIVNLLDGQEIPVKVECIEVVRSGQKRVVSVVMPEAGVFESYLQAARDMPLGSLGYTASTYEGEFVARFKWQPGKSKGGTMNVSLQPIN
jgi:hypothetical protein